MKKEKYLICPKCGDMTLYSTLLYNIETQGCNGYCDCCFTETFWNEETDCLDFDTTRMYYDYIEISENLYAFLSGYNNEVLRLKTFNCIPKDKLKTFNGK